MYLKCLGYKTLLLSKHKKNGIALAYSDSLLLESKRLNDTFYIAKAYYKKGWYNAKLNNSVKAFNNYTLSKKYFLKLNDSNQVAGKLLNMGKIQKDLGDLGGAKKTVIEGLKFQSNITTKKHISQLYSTLSSIKKEEKQFDEALKYRKKSIFLLKELNDKLSRKDSINLLKYLNNKAVIYIKQQKYSEGQEILTKTNVIYKDYLKKNLKEILTIYLKIYTIRCMPQITFVV